jgi:hypothetical protein
MEAHATITLDRSEADHDATASRSDDRRTYGWTVISRILGIAPYGNALPDLIPNTFSLLPPAALAVNAAAALLLAAYAANAAIEGFGWAVALFYGAVALLFGPIVAVLTLPTVKRWERITNILTAAIGLYILRIIRAPIFFLGHDEYLHWVTADHIIERGRLFDANVLFPISPFFPGLEIVTTAFSNLTGASIFVASIIVLCAARILFISCLFLFFEHLLGSARAASLGCLFYMGCSTFVFFDTNFSYESLALPLLAFALAMDAAMRDLPSSKTPALLCLFGIDVLALTMTHHLTAYALSAFFLAFFVSQIIGGGFRAISPRNALAVFLSVSIPIVWSRAMGDPGRAYLGPVFENGVREVISLLHFGSTGRSLFTGDDGTVAPLWQRLVLIGSVILTSIGLTLGFFRTLSLAGLFTSGKATPGSTCRSLEWAKARLAVLTLAAIGYPISIVFRLTRSGWEIGNRIGAFSYFGVAIILAVLVATVLQGSSRSAVRAVAIAAGASVLLLGGIISSEGPRILVPQMYQVSADAASIEPMGIEAAQWTKAWLGLDRHFVADRVNGLLLSGFGHQLVSTTLQHGFDAGAVLVAPTFADAERSLLRRLGIDYLLADLRLTTGLPVVGSYFDGSTADEMLKGPPQPATLVKFNNESDISRIFDNGYEIIYDVRTISGRR